MSSTYAGDPNTYPTSIQLPSDGDGPGIKAADINAALEGLADRTAHLKADVAATNALVRNAPELQFSAVQAMPLPVTMVKFNAASGFWYAIGPGPSGAPNQASVVAAESVNVWEPTTELADGGFPQAPADIAFDDAGTAIMLDANIDYFDQYDGSIWSFAGGAFGNDWLTAPSIVWDPVTRNYVVAGKYSNSAPYLQIATTHDAGGVWTSRTPPAGIPSTVLACTLETDGLGTIWMQIFDAAANVHFSSSTNGGVTWSALTTVAIAGISALPTKGYPRPAFNGSTWGAVVPVRTGSGSFAMLRKLATGSWTLVHIYTGKSSAESIAAHPLGSFAVLLRSKHLLISNDDLATLRYTDWSAQSGNASSGDLSAYHVTCNGIRFAIAGENIGASHYAWFSGGAGAGGGLF